MLPRSNRTHWFLFVATLGVIGAGAACLFFVPPSAGSYYPKCQFFTWTGLHCPGCGTTRCLHSLVHGDVAQAAAYNALSLVFIPTVVAWGFSGWFQVLRGRPFPKWFFTPMFCRWLIIIFLLFGLIRNLPFYPFTLLVPPPL